MPRGRDSDTDSDASWLANHGGDGATTVKTTADACGPALKLQSTSVSCRARPALHVLRCAAASDNLALNHRDWHDKCRGRPRWGRDSQLQASPDVLLIMGAIHSGFHRSSELLKNLIGKLKNLAL